MVIQPFLSAVNWGVVGWVLVGAVALIVVVAAVGRAIAAAFPPKLRRKTFPERREARRNRRRFRAAQAAKFFETPLECGQ